MHTQTHYFPIYFLKKEYSDNKSFYDDNFKTLGEEVTNIGKINLELKKLKTSHSYTMGKS